MKRNGNKLTIIQDQQDQQDQQDRQPYNTYRGDKLMNDNTNKTNNLTTPTSDHLLRAYETFRDHLYLLGSESITEEQLDQLYNTFVHITCAGKTVSIPFDATIYNILVSLIETMIKEF